MHVAQVKIKAYPEIVACVILVLNLNKYVEAQSEDDVRILRKTCLLKPEHGPCRGNILMNYFDPKTGKCKLFTWGGCQGNGNRFDTREECYSNCLGNVSDLVKYSPRYCFLNFDYGFCFGSVPRYYYDNLWKVCKERLYSGCGGNKNNFYNLNQCESVCRFGNGYLAGKQIKKSKSGQAKVAKVIIINPPSAKKSSGAAAAADKT